MLLPASTAVGEDARAAARALLGLSVAVGAMAAGAAALIGDSLMVIGIPTLALGAALARGAVAPAGYAAAAIWLVFVPRVGGEALLVPLAMSLACLALAIGPDRLRRWTRRHDPEARSEGWIEEL